MVILAQARDHMSSCIFKILKFTYLIFRDSIKESIKEIKLGANEDMYQNLCSTGTTKLS